MRGFAPLYFRTLLYVRRDLVRAFTAPHFRFAFDSRYATIREWLDSGPLFHEANFDFSDCDIIPSLGPPDYGLAG